MTPEKETELRTKLDESIKIRKQIDKLKLMLNLLDTNSIRIVSFRPSQKSNALQSPPSRIQEQVIESFDRLNTRGFSQNLENRLRNVIGQEIQHTIDQLEAEYESL